MEESQTQILRRKLTKTTMTLTLILHGKQWRGKQSGWPGLGLTQPTGKLLSNALLFWATVLIHTATRFEEIAASTCHSHSRQPVPDSGHPTDNSSAALVP